MCFKHKQAFLIILLNCYIVRFLSLIFVSLCVCVYFFLMCTYSGTEFFFCYILQHNALQGEYLHLYLLKIVYWVSNSNSY